MKTLQTLKAGDEVAVMHTIRGGEISGRLTSVIKSTAKIIETPSGKFDKATGKPITKQTTGWLSLNLSDLEPLRAKRAEVQARIEEDWKAEQEKSARTTYQLACTIVNSVEPEKTIAALERLGKQRLQLIVEWLQIPVTLANKFHIQRYPNRAGLLRGPNMMAKMCLSCLDDKTHGFYLYDSGELSGQSISMFVCDDCLTQAKKEPK